jgi:phage terminase large subunit GpA-like protein
LTNLCLGREYVRDDGAAMRIERMLIDASWGQVTDVVYRFCRGSAHAAVLMPSHGRFVGASSRPIAEYRRSPGDRLGLNWKIPHVKGQRAVRHVFYDTNFWKSFVFARLATSQGSPGCLSLFGDNPVAHRMLADHLTAEYCIRVESHLRAVDEWRLRPDRHDNHWFDALVGCAVAASIQGLALAERAEVQSPQARRKLSQLRKQRHLVAGIRNNMA